MTDKRLQHAAGTLLVVMLGLAVLAGIGVAFVEPLAGVCAWAAAALLWRELAPGQRRQCAALVCVGLAALVWAISTGGAIVPGRLLNENLGMLAMIAGVSFIRLAAPDARAATTQTPRGSRALLSTLLGLNALGAAINITALVLVGDRIARHGRLNVLEASTLARAFSLAVMYSPFIGGMAFALSRAPDVGLANIAVYGLVLVAIGIGVTWLGAMRTGGNALASFEGYPFRPDALWFPGLLAAGVLAVHFVFDAVPVLTVIAGLAPLAACSALGGRVGPGRAAARALGHVQGQLPKMAGELWLFLAAGVLAVGLSSAFSVASVDLPVESVGGATASVALLLVIVSSVAGLHPVIALSAIVPLLQPLDPAPLLVALLCVCGWSIGCTVCPYSGINLIIQGRFGLDAWRLSKLSWGYAFFMWLMASVAFTVAAGEL